MIALRFLLVAGLGLVCSLSKGLAQPTPELTQSWRPLPSRAFWMGIACPGAGQIYNRQMWKTPVVIGTLLAMGYYVHQQHRVYDYLSDALHHIRYGDGSPTGLLGERENLITSNRGIARRNRDYLAILTTLLYLLQSVEALASAHLYNFDVTPSVAKIQWAPHIRTLRTNANTFTTWGIALNIALRY